MDRAHVYVRLKQVGLKERVCEALAVIVGLKADN